MPSMATPQLPIIENVEGVWDISGSSAGQAEPSKGSNPHYLIKQTRTLGMTADALEVQFLGFSERMREAPDGVLEDGRGVTFYVSPGGELRHLLERVSTGGALLQKQDGSTWRVAAIDFFQGTNEPARGRLEQVARPLPPLSEAKNATDRLLSSAVAYLVDRGLQNCPRCNRLLGWSAELHGILVADLPMRRGFLNSIPQHSRPSRVLPAVILTCNFCSFSSIHNLKAMGLVQ